MVQGRERDLHVSCGRSNNAYQIDVVPGDQVFPIIGDVVNAKLLRDTLGAFTMAARYCNYARALAVLEAGNLRRASEAGADNSNADSFVVTQTFQTSLLFPLFNSAALAGIQWLVTFRNYNTLQTVSSPIAMG
jgi:hypothetical protein